MPSTSKKQHNFMAAVANNPSFAKKAGVPQSVGKEFNEADKGRKFSKGGDMKTDSQFDADVDRAKRSLYKNKEDSKIYSRERGLSPGMAAKRLENRGVDVRALVANEQNPDDRGDFKKGGKVKKMNMGGYAGGGMPMKNGKPAFIGDGKGMASGGMAKGKMPAALAKHAGMPASKAHKGLKAGGMAASKMGSVKTSSSRDGIATKGKTKGTMITMKNGGKC